ncbi:potassium channel family protein [Geomonas ferrireducens]|uniref:potassium channel family protein n=1 Tax=Geomonas ferrireducens TaxID=2570227 RepID=UPI0010A7AF8D|nr:potassium channel family protein [Geomonas ferrireducens]
MDSFIVTFWGRIFSTLKWVSPFQLIFSYLPSRFKTHGFVDVWVLLNLLFSIITVFLSTRFHESICVKILLIYAWLRVLEIVVYQTNVLFFDGYGKANTSSPYRLRSYRRIVILSLHNYTEIIFWFAAAYSYFRNQFGLYASKLGSFIGATYYSLVTMATLGYGDISPDNDYGRCIVLLHVAVAVFMTILILARLVSYLPMPQTMDEDEINKSST